MISLRKPHLWAITAICGGLFFGSAYPMAQRIRAFNQEARFPHFFAEPLDARHITLRGFPELTLKDHPTQPDQPFSLEVTYGAKPPFLVPVKAPTAIDLPTLGIYDEWLKVLAVNQVERGPDGSQHPLAGSERLLIVVRRTPEGFDPEAWGQVRRSEWVFDFYDLRPDGTYTQFTQRWPRKDMREDQFQEQARAADAEPWVKALAAIPPLRERSIEYFAALHVIPKLNVPQHKFTDTAFSPRIMGWTLPVSMLAGLGFFISLFFALAPARRAPAGLSARPVA